jgi:septum formation protein
MLILASASPRRRELLQRIGFEISVQPADVDESTLPGETATSYAARVSALKADALAADAWVLAADTVVEIDGAILGKAADERDARAMLERLLGRDHRVTTAFSIRGPGGVSVDRLVTTEVTMRTASAQELDGYVAAGEWRGKAGAYAVQGMAAAFVTGVQGSITNVIGLPLSEVVEALAAAGAATPDYRRGAPA